MTSFDNLRSDLLTPIALPKSPRYPAIADIFKVYASYSRKSASFLWIAELLGQPLSPNKIVSLKPDSDRWARWWQ